jgi:hypothetical chaperone protein
MSPVVKGSLMKTALGLDFGTTNSALAITRDGRVDVIAADEYNRTGKTLRSVLFFEKGQNIFAGRQAVTRYIETGGEGRFLQSIKSFLPSTLFEYTVISGRKYELEDLIAIILRRLKKKAEACLGREVADVVMGRPVVFSEDKKTDLFAQDRLRRAAEMAGFKNIVFQYEPIAAGLTFEKGLLPHEEKLVLIGDFGGGTSDFSIIRLHGGRSANPDREKDVLSLGGLPVAGDAFDSELMWEKAAKFFGKDVKFKTMSGAWLDMPTSITLKLRKWHLIPLLGTKQTLEYLAGLKLSADDSGAIENLMNLIGDNYGFMLFQAIERAKIELSSSASSRICFGERLLMIDEMVSRMEFEDIVSEKVATIERRIDDTLSGAGLRPDDIDLVFTTGGTSCIPCIRNLFNRKFGSRKMKQMDAFTSVAYGLGISASLFFD